MYEMDQYTVALLHFDGDFKDESGKVWTANGGAGLSTAQSKFGGSSVYFEGKEEMNISTPITKDLQLGNDLFTIDFWMNMDSHGIDMIAGTIPGWRMEGGWSILTHVDRRIYFYQGASGFDDVVYTGTDVYTPGTWTHIAVVKDKSNSTNVKIYVNGIKKADGNLSKATIVDSTVPLRIGRGYETWNAKYPCKGYVDEFRISKGIARWTEDFIPPTKTDKPSIGAPTNLSATAGDTKVTLSWTAVTGAIGYNVKRSTIAGGSYTTVGANVTGTSYVDTTAVNGTTYYYVITALTADGESGNSNEVTAAPKAGSVTPPVPTEEGLLRITMSDSSEREYKVTEAVVQDFIKWFNRNNVTISNTSYMFNKAINGGKEYLSCSKIISFEAVVKSGQTLLRITMSDSSEREYNVSAAELDNFIKWFNYTVGAASNYYVFDKAINSAKEYLFFDKIISFEVMPIKS